MFSLTDIIQTLWTISHANNYSNISAVNRHLNLSGQIGHLNVISTAYALTFCLTSTYTAVKRNLTFKSHSCNPLNKMFLSQPQSRYCYCYYFYKPTSTKPTGVNTETKQSVNGCNGASFGDNGVLQGHNIPSRKSHGQAVEQECCFTAVLSNAGYVSANPYAMAWPIYCHVVPCTRYCCWCCY